MLIISFVTIIIFYQEKDLFANNSNNPEDNLQANQELFNQVIYHIKSNYYTKVNDDILFQGAIKGMISSLDSYSTYLSPKEYSEMKKTTDGQFSGIGVDIMPPDINGLIKIISPYEGGPSFKAGIKSGDIILAIDDVEVGDMDFFSVIESLRGNIGTKVKIRILRDFSKIIEFTIVRELIKIIPVQIKILPNSKTVYIKIRVFNNLTQKIINKEYAKILQTKEFIPDSIILDLRYNPGGLLEQAINVSELFLAKNKKIVSIYGINNQNIQEYKTLDSKDITNDLPIIVLINGGTASAAEIVAAAIRDNNRGILVGETSFGKASVQTIIPLANGAAIKLSTATYHTPNGQLIHGKGINPDIYIDSQGKILSSDFKYNYLDSNNGKEIEKDNTNISTDTKNDFKTIVLDSQLNRAFEILKIMIFYKKNNCYDQ
ncbi:S41 family peptidase [Lyticum sinuosum]|uniref:S41 family peptidase n=1 Tax=Lyticum sinuosum TaxID=1332059 RepID=A0AAE5AHJ4_9RICK|nr:S41 family peptidase [Lyticum sinuosum]MDZ5761625.1 S41 family peptidase [Lyticum sinuosum]